jgi:hypothetical protein
MRRFNADCAFTAAGRAVVILLLAALLVGGCSVFGEKPGTKQDQSGGTHTVWQYVDQYIRIAHQDVEEGQIPPQPNAHPVKLSVKEIQSLLGSLEVRLAEGDQPVPVFTDAELAILGDAVSKALAEASPHQDVVVAIAGYHGVMFGTLKVRRLTTGRIFFQDEKLHVIFREIQGEYDDKEDRRMHPLVPGSRLAPQAHMWRLALTPGVEFVQSRGTLRSDWVAIDTETVLARVAEADRRQQGNEHVIDGTTRGATAESIEQRLSTLKRLFENGLITEKQFNDKRQNILDEL